MSDYTEGRKGASTGSFMPEITASMPSEKEIRRRLGDMQSRAPSVQMNAINKSLTSVNQHLTASMRKRYAYRYKTAKPRKIKAKRSDLSGKLIYSGDVVNLGYFDYHKGKRGTHPTLPGQKLTARALLSNSRKEISRAFVMKSGSTNLIFRRLTDEKRAQKRAKKPAHKYEIEGLYGPTYATMAGNTWDQREEQEYTRKVLREKLDEQIQKQYLKKWSAK